MGCTRLGQPVWHPATVASQYKDTRIVETHHSILAAMVLPSKDSSLGNKSSHYGEKSLYLASMSYYLTLSLLLCGAYPEASPSKSHLHERSKSVISVHSQRCFQYSLKLLGGFQINAFSPSV